MIFSYNFLICFFWYPVLSPQYKKLGIGPAKDHLWPKKPLNSIQIKKGGKFWYFFYNFLICFFLYPVLSPQYKKLGLGPAKDHLWPKKPLNSIQIKKGLRYPYKSIIFGFNNPYILFSKYLRPGPAKDHLWPKNSPKKL